MRRAKSKSQKIRELVRRGYTTRYIVEKLQVSPQVVYNIRYHLNKQQGLGALAPRKVRAGTGIVEDAVVITPTASTTASNSTPRVPSVPEEVPMSRMQRIKAVLLTIVRMGAR